jgi:cytochrome c5
LDYAVKKTTIVIVILMLVTTALAVFAGEPDGEAAKQPRSGDAVYHVYCGSCHEAGWQGAPIANDKNDWEPRLSKGADALLINARAGLNGMPAMGTCMDCSDVELTAAIREMTRF